jgi:hypothetical protein
MGISVLEGHDTPIFRAEDGMEPVGFSKTSVPVIEYRMASHLRRPKNVYFSEVYIHVCHKI